MRVRQWVGIHSRCDQPGDMGHIHHELGIDVVPLKPIWKSVAASGAELNWWRTKILPGQLICPNPQEVASAQWLRIDDIISHPLLLASNLAFFSALERGDFDLD